MITATMSVGGEQHQCSGTTKQGQRCARVGFVVSYELAWYCVDHGQTHDERGRRIPSALRNQPA